MHAGVTVAACILIAFTFYVRFKMGAIHDCAWVRMTINTREHGVRAKVSILWNQPRSVDNAQNHVYLCNVHKGQNPEADGEVRDVSDPRAP